MAGLMTIASSRSYLNLTILALFWMLQSRCTCAVDVRELASSIVSAVCEASDSDVQEFYTSLSSSYASSQDQQYPDPQLGTCHHGDDSLHCIYAVMLRFIDLLFQIQPRILFL